MNILEQKIFDSSIIKQAVFKGFYIESNLISKCSNIKTADAYAKNLPFIDVSIDLVMTLVVLYQIKRTVDGKREINMVLKNNGIFIFYLFYNLVNKSKLLNLIFKIINIMRIIISKFQEKIENTFCKFISIFMYFNLFLLGKFLQNCLVEKLLDIGIKIFILIEMILAPFLEYFLKKDIQELK